MSADQQGLRQTYTEQLSDFAVRLSQPMGDAALQRDVFRTIRDLMQQHSDSESDIRRVLYSRFEAGQIRKETLLMVQQMIDRVLSEHVDTLTGNGDDGGDAGHTSTDVLDKNVSVLFDTTDHLQAGSILRDRFLLQKQVAGGSMGDVYKALDRRLAEVEGVDPWVAIKVLTPKLSRNANALRAIQQEAAKIRCLTHPNIVRFIDLDREDDVYFMVMEWIEGRSLAAILDDPETRKMDSRRIDEILRQLAAALEYAHRCGVVHADVKPGNVMEMPDGRIKLIDFGVARIRQTRSEGGKPFDPGVLGAATPAYSSMQVLTGEAPAPADDVFSLACLAYRLFAGYRVFGPRNAAEAAEEGMSPQQPNGMSDERWSVLKKALSFARVARYASPREFIDEYLATTGPTPRIEIPPKEAPQDDEHPRRAPAVGLALLLLAAAGGAWYFGYLDDYLPPEAASTLITGRVPPADTTTAAPQPGVPEEPATDAEAPGTAVTAAAPSPDAATPETPAASAPAETADLPVAEGTAADPDAAVAAPAETEAPADGADPYAGREQLFVPIEDIDGGAAGGNTVPEPAGTAADGEQPVEQTAGLASDQPAGQPVEDAAVRPEPVAAPAGPQRLEPTDRLVLGGAVGPGDAPLRVAIREDGPAAVIDLVRVQTGGALDIVVEERGAEGNGSAWEAGQYSLRDDGRVSFAPGGSLAQLVIRMTSDPVREPDRSVQLALVDAYNGDELGYIDLRLEDDDQRRFEARLPPNTVGFAASQVSVGEGETAVQIDLVRYKPDASVLTVNYRVQDVTATMDVDYFTPATGTVTFEPNSRSARILVPLVQDVEPEPDEAFFIELDGPQSGSTAGIYRRIAVMIRDDDS